MSFFYQSFRILSMVFISAAAQSVYGLETQEIESFMNNLEQLSKKVGINHKIEIFDCKSDVVALVKTKLAYNSDVPTFKLLVNFDLFKNYTAEEQEFILLHELIHIKKPYIYSILLTNAGLNLAKVCGVMASFVLYKPNCDKAWLNYVGKASVGFSMLSVLRLAGAFISAQISQKAEYEADALAFMIQKNSAAACGFFEKAKKDQEACSYSWIKNLFSSHPSEDARIANIKKLEQDMQH